MKKRKCFDILHVVGTAADECQRELDDDQLQIHMFYRHDKLLLIDYVLRTSREIK
jgi:hypothetical protein